MLQKTILDNGVRIVSEQLPFSTVALGIWVDTGSRDELDAESGCAHFVEHMLFKGTDRRSAVQIARELDGLGGMSNAFTSKENTCIYATVLDSHFSRLADILCDLFLNSTFADEEVLRERQVILQEISMVEDTPDDQIHDLFAGLILSGHPLGRGVLGTRESVEALNAERLRDYVRRHYTPDRIVIAAAGNIEHRQLCDLVGAAFSRLTRRAVDQPGQRQPPSPVLPGQRVYPKPLEQVHIITGTPGLAAIDPQRYTLHLLNTILGGNMSSRLFQEIREKHGLAYSIYSYLSPFADCGYIGVYLGVEQQSAAQALELINCEIDKLCREPVSATELTNAKEYAKGILYLSAENMESRMTQLAHNEFYFGRHISIAETVAELERVSAGDLARLAGELFGDRRFSTTILGPEITGAPVGEGNP